ncbi:MAG: ATP synthase subunit C [Sphaerochaeta sp.]|nr:ATP synthase subunit C [Sphaerochaeta sp.]MCI2096530.1 ATP synthase subunit C [Sphaerochaeta sp.]
MLLVSSALFAEGTQTAGTYNLAFVCFAAAIAFSIGALAAGMAIGKVGSAAMGAISERPEIASQALIFIALAEGLVVFGFITALMILAKI